MSLMKQSACSLRGLAGKDGWLVGQDTVGLLRRAGSRMGAVPIVNTAVRPLHPLLPSPAALAQSTTPYA